MAEDKSSKTEQPTAKRRREARQKGQVARSQEVNSVSVLMAGLFVLFFAAHNIYRQLSGLMIDHLSNAGRLSRDNGELGAFLLEKVNGLSFALAPVMLGIFLAALLSNLLQVGPMLSGEPIVPKLSKINPLKGFSRILSSRSLNELFKSIAKMAIISATAFFTVRGEMDSILGLGQLAPSQIGLFALTVAFKIFIKTCWIFIIIAFLDYIYQRWQFETQLKMTKEEIREEHKQTEGDPHVKARIRSIQRDMARKRMMEQVPGADVVVANPTHLAVALTYDPVKADAPVVVAKGRGLIAAKIKEIAAENDIPIIEDKALARGLYKSVEIGEMIPIEFYQAVADILAYVYQVKGKVINA